MLMTLLGGALGGLLRLAPEVLKLIDAKNERKHELEMQDKALEFQKIKGSQRLDEISAEGQQEWNKKALDALRESIKGQSTPSGVKWVDAFSSIQRPLITFQWVVLLYPAVIIAKIIILVTGGMATPEALLTVFGPEEKAIASGIINFWFLNRVLPRQK
jgi:hypothetical protein